jgi:cytochrome c biogenesis protein CcdA
VAETSVQDPTLRTSDQRSVGDLLRELRDESTALVEDKLALFKTEMIEKGSAAVQDARSLGTAAAVLHVALFLILLAVSVFVSSGLLAIGTTPLLSFALGPLIVGIVVGAIGLVVMKRASTSLSSDSMKPDRTVRSMKETKEWVQKRV